METPATVGSSGGVANESGLVISNIPVSYCVEETGYDFGFISPDSISGFALNDTTNTGVLFSPAPSTLQPGIGGITILLTGTDNLGHHVAAEVTTSADGSYSFEGLRPGVYQVTEFNTGSVGWFAEAAYPGTFEPQYGPLAGLTVSPGYQLVPSVIAGIDIGGSPSTVITDTEGYNYDFLNLPA